MWIRAASFLIALGAAAQAGRPSPFSADQRIQRYQKLSAAQPDSAHAQNLLASAFVLKMRETTDPAYLIRASKLVDRVLAREPANYEALRLKTEVALENHNFREAAASSRALIETAPQDPANWGTLGDALMELGDYDGAADAYQRMVELRPDLSSYNRAAWYRYVTGDNAGAIEFMKLAIGAGTSLPENMAWCWVELGNLYLRTGRSVDALEAYGQARRFMPNYHAAWAGTGKALAQSGNLKAAAAPLEKALAIVPMPDYAAALHDVYALLGKRAEAARQLALLDVLDRMDRAGSETGNRALAMAYANHDYRLPRAAALTDTELTIRQDVFTWDAWAWVQFKGGKFAEARAAMKKAMAQGTQDAAMYFHAGMIAAAVGEKGEAVKSLEKALELNPNFDLRLSVVAKDRLRALN
jgi:tetratricopeptide (TPR) repeat protein